MKWGSQFESTFPLVKARYVFKNTISPIDFLNLLREERKNWDENLLELSNLTIINPEVSIIHYAMKPPIFFMKAKDFAEKQIAFCENGIFYGYYSSVPNTAVPVKDQYQRCETVFGGNILYIEGDDIVYYVFSQVDLKIGNVPAAVVTSYIPGATKTFHTKVSSEIEKRRSSRAPPLPNAA